MTFNEAFRKGIELLKNAGNEAPALDAGVLLCSVANCDRAFLYAHGTDEFDGILLERYVSMLERRAEGVPLQYLTGVQEFMSLSFSVGPGVLVPRQETELLVETVIQWCQEYVQKAAILDIGTGSGCIAVSLAHYLPDSCIMAVDKMPDAIAIAEKNARSNGVAGRVRFIQSDLFGRLAGEKFDVIVSNPPYIRKGDISGLQKEVRCHEPAEALDGGNDGLDFYRAIIKEAPGFLKRGGMLAFETGYDQAGDVSLLMSDGFSSVKIMKDLSGIDRVVSGIVC